MKKLAFTLALSLASASAAASLGLSLSPVNISNVHAFPVAGSCDGSGIVTFTALNQQVANVALTVTAPCSGGAYDLGALDMSALSDGDLTAVLTQTDSGGTPRAAWGKFAKDTVSPTFSVSAIPDVLPTNPLLSPTMTCSEASRVTITVGSLVSSYDGCGGGIDVSTLPNGTYTATISVADMVNNPAGSTVSMTFTKRMRPKRYHVDFDGRSGADLPWFQASTGLTGLWIANPPPSPFYPHLAAAVTGPSGARVVQIADFNDDAKSDLLWRGAAGDYSIGLMDGLTQTSLTQIYAGGAWEVVRVADLNGDLKSDLIWRKNTGEFGAWLMNGAAATAMDNLANPGAGFDIAAIGDFDGDGKEDIVWTHPDGRVVLALMDGFTARASTQLQAAGAGWQVLDAADFDGDGRSDLLWKHGDTYTVWWMNGTTVRATLDERVNSPGWRTVMPRDVDGNGTMEILWQSTTGAVEVTGFGGSIPSSFGTTYFSPWPLLGAGTGWWLVGSDTYDGTRADGLLWRSDAGEYGMWTSFLPPSQCARFTCGGFYTREGSISPAGTGWEVQPLPR